MKLIGIIMAAFSCSCAGFLAAQKYNTVLKGIIRTEKFIKNIILCLQNERMSIPDMLDYISSFSDEKTRLFICNLYGFDFTDIDKMAFECGFSEDETANLMLKEAFFVLGKFSAEEQINELVLCRNKLVNYIEKVSGILENKAKFAKRIGFICGIFIVVILI